ncbi:MAG: hypothetical protein CVV51_00350 [Spirochaetae bacterium HGW-Spirochaetae-7]|jgi:nickel-dependent lactate racemase|nr:MAG: hypothetical protein CVV51_00350 [Spirochaetae bacterium HGW-Spirochaetae-7]
MKMKHGLPYGDGEIEVELPDDRLDWIVAERVPERDELPIVLAAIDGAEPGLLEFLGRSASVAVVVSDHTRNTGSRTYMPILLDRIRMPGRRITVVVALGLHRPSTDSEIATILGCIPDKDVDIINHDPDGNLEACGQGTFCKAVVEADKVILTGSVSFHPMAGYSGGWKSLLPGIASRACVLDNHRLFFSGDKRHPGVGPARVELNPVSMDIRSRTRGFAGKTWCLNVVQSESKAIVFATAGGVDDAWTACCGYLERMNSPSIRRLYPVVVASSGGYPSDFSFYQSMKTLTNASRACVKGGSIYLAMECRNGWELDESVLSWSRDSLDTIATRLRKEFSMSGLAMHMALSVIRDHSIACLSSLPEQEVCGMGMRYLASAADLGKAVAAEDADRIAVIPAAAATLPALRR